MLRVVYTPAIAAALLSVAAATASAGTINCPANIFNRTVDNVFVNGVCTLRNATVEGNVVVGTNGNLLVLGSTIKGSVQSEGGKRVRLRTDPTTGRDTQVNGDVQIVTTVAGLTSAIDGVAVGGTVLLDENAAPVNVFANDVGGDVQVFGNSAVVRLRDNTIDGNLQCKENTPSPINGGGNIVQGTSEDQCAGFSQ